jgi:carboxypeptidase PM20D1
MKGSDARNVIPPEASLVSNIRLNPADSVNSALDYLRSVIDDELITVSAIESSEPSPISETNCEQWNRVASAAASTWKGSIVSPYLMVQCSDSRHYKDLSNHVYRFSAMDLTAEERKTIHGHNERIRLETIEKSVEFYIRLLSNS